MLNSLSSAWNSRIPQTLKKVSSQGTDREHKGSHVGISYRLPERYRKEGDSFLNRIITDDEN
jgi:hypothetical protein